jgi:Lipase maturation factor
MTGARARWLWLRALCGIFLSAFVSLYFQIEGLIGSRGLLPAQTYLQQLRILGPKRFWFVPTLLWLNASDAMLMAIVWIGLVASVAILANLWPRVSIAVAGVAFLSFVAAAQDFSGYQSDGMLLDAALLSIFLAPRGLRPGLAEGQPVNAGALFMLRWLWFRIYFESGVVKILSGETQWRDFTAMDKYYENGPLPTSIGWFVQQRLPHGVHAATVAYTLVAELLIAWLVFFPKQSRRIAFALTTPLQIAIIVTANYAFLNYLVLFLGVLLLDRGEGQARVPVLHRAVFAMLFVTAVASFLVPAFPLVSLLEPFRVANRFGLFAVMTRARYEIEFQGSYDGEHWVAYPFRFKPQDPMTAPGIYAPYQPRFDWNLWFASLGDSFENPFVLNCEAQLLEGSPPVLRLFAGNPFAARPPTMVRAVKWQYWFTTPAERARTGAWWNRKFLGEYAPAIAK